MRRYSSKSRKELCKLKFKIKKSKINLNKKSSFTRALILIEGDNYLLKPLIVCFNGFVGVFGGMYHVYYGRC